MEVFKKYGLFSLFGLVFPAGVLGVGQMPVPTLENVQFSVSVVYEAAESGRTYGLYRYHYGFQNPASNTGEISSVEINTQTEQKFLDDNLDYHDYPSLTVPMGGNRYSFIEEAEEVSTSSAYAPVPFGMELPGAWSGGVSIRATAWFGRGNDEQVAYQLNPGANLDGFYLISPGIPTIRKITAKPHWVMVAEDVHAITDEQFAEMSRVEEELPDSGYTLGPSGLASFGSIRHWELLSNNLDRANKLGWVSDEMLLKDLKSQLVHAREALNDRDGTLARERLQVALDTIGASTPDQRSQEFYDLVRLNLIMLKSHTRETPVEYKPELSMMFDPIYEMSPDRQSQPIGTEQTVTAKITNLADHEALVPPHEIRIYVAEGPNEGLAWEGVTDPGGEFEVTYQSDSVGTDAVVWEYANPLVLQPPPKTSVGSGIFAWHLNSLHAGSRPIQLASNSQNLEGLVTLSDTYPDALATAEVQWTGGADLVIPFFLPPTLLSKGGNEIYITDITENIGVLPTRASVTKYYVSEEPQFLPEDALFVGERLVGHLAPNEDSHSAVVEGDQVFTLPSPLKEGKYYLAACADADSDIVETDETNNCSFNKLNHAVSVTVPLEKPSNHPPDCSQATLSEASLWPPNHKLVPVSVLGIADPEGDSVTVRFTAIEQNEPVNNTGDGDHSPDGFGVGTSEVRLRAERAGTKRGRVYFLSFVASDSQGAQCEGQLATVVTPHDKGRFNTIESAEPVYDSTVP